MLRRYSTTSTTFALLSMGLLGCSETPASTAQTTADATSETSGGHTSSASDESLGSSHMPPNHTSTNADPSSGTGPDVAVPSETGSGPTPPVRPQDDEVAACRTYYETICSRIRECGASSFRPCESPADLCPDILFGTSSSWTLDDVKLCTEAWATHDCDQLNYDLWPACATRPGTRADTEPCAFSSECSSGLCHNALSETFTDACGQCVTPAQPDAPCDDASPCINGYFCSDEGLCQAYYDHPRQPANCSDCSADEECYEGTCVTAALGFLPEGAVCSPLTVCAEGLGCGIELVDDEANEPKQGTCQPLPPIGSGCLPTFISLGLCAEGGTCDSRPTGACVALKEIGDYCGYASCVEEAFCQVLGIPDEVLPSHTCYERFSEGDPCYIEGDDYLCKDELGCRCAEPGCEPTCVHLGQPGEPCNTPKDCESVLCIDGACVDVGDGSLGSLCSRTSDFGRTGGWCNAGGGVECLCSDASCVTAHCAHARDNGETCDTTTDLCRLGFACVEGRCVATGSQGLSARVCD